MKCVCGYERLESWQTCDGVAVGDKKFLMLDFELYPTVQIESDYSYRTESPDIYACPKCGTLKIEL